MDRNAGIGALAGGRECPDCGELVGIVDWFCRYCGARVRHEEDEA